jgi:hypothetical protein
MEQFNWTAIILGFAVGWVITKFIQGYLEAKNQVLREELAALISTYIFVKPEKHGDMIYLFDAYTDSFVAQGRTAEELAGNCKSRYPNKNILISKDYADQIDELKDTFEYVPPKDLTA